MLKEQNRQSLESALNTFLYNYLYEVVNPRLEEFSQNYYKSPWQMFKRHFRNDIRDLFISINNLFSWISTLLKGKEFSKTSPSEKELLEKFTNEIFCVDILHHRLQLFLDQFLLEQFKDEQVKKEKLIDYTQTWKDEIAYKALEVTHLKRLSTKAASFLLDMGLSTGLIGELSRGLGTVVGAYAARELYLSQQNIFYYYWYSFTGIPSWVEISGSIIGAVLAIIVFVPLVGTIIEYMMQPFNDTAKQIRQAYPDLINKLLYGEDKYKKNGLMEYSIKYLDSCTNILDSLRSVTRAL